MVLKVRNGCSYGDDPQDLQAEMLDHSKQTGYKVDHFADAVCGECSSTGFRVLLDDEEGCAVRICLSCKAQHYIGDSAQYAQDATLGDCSCPCGQEAFQVSIGVHLYAGSNDVKWLYLGLRCISCGLVAVYGDWKNEYEGYERLLQMV